MGDEVPPTLLRALHQVGVGLLSGHLDVATAVQLAEELVAAGRTDQPTVAAACLPRGATRRDAEPVVREMLTAYGIRVPVDPTEDDTFGAAAVAFGWWGLPLSEFVATFVDRLPRRLEQGALDRDVLALLEYREHLPWVLGPERGRTETRLREMVRAAFPLPGG